MQCRENILELPNEMLLNIFRRLSFRDRLNSTMVCSRFRQVISNYLHFNGQYVVLGQESNFNKIQRKFKSLKFVYLNMNVHLKAALNANRMWLQTAKFISHSTINTPQLLKHLSTFPKLQYIVVNRSGRLYVNKQSTLKTLHLCDIVVDKIKPEKTLCHYERIVFDMCTSFPQLQLNNLKCLDIDCINLAPRHIDICKFSCPTLKTFSLKGVENCVSMQQISTVFPNIEALSLKYSVLNRDEDDFATPVFRHVTALELIDVVPHSWRVSFPQLQALNIIFTEAVDDSFQHFMEKHSFVESLKLSYNTPIHEPYPFNLAWIEFGNLKRVEFLNVTITNFSIPPKLLSIELHYFHMIMDNKMLYDVLRKIKKGSVQRVYIRLIADFLFSRQIYKLCGVKCTKNMIAYGYELRLTKKNKNKFQIKKRKI